MYIGHELCAISTNFFLIQIKKNSYGFNVFFMAVFMSPELLKKFTQRKLFTI